MSARKLHECQPIGRFLTPADTHTAPFGEPTQGAFHHPATGRDLRLARDRALLDRGLAPATPVFDVSDVAFLFDKLMYIGIIVAPVQTDVLSHVCRVRTRYDNRDDQVIGRPFVVAIGAGDEHGERRATLVDQQVNLAALFTPVGWVPTGLLSSQGRWTAFAINRLPFPLHLAAFAIELHHDPHDLLKDALSLPGLETLMQCAAAHTEPLLVYGFPLAARPQHVPNTIEHRPIVGWWSPWPALLEFFRQHLPDLSPQRARDMKVIDVFRFWGRVVAQVASRFGMVGRSSILFEMRSFSIPNSFYG